MIKLRKTTIEIRRVDALCSVSYVQLFVFQVFRKLWREPLRTNATNCGNIVKSDYNGIPKTCPCA
jgi:hypothetical protein